VQGGRSFCVSFFFPDGALSSRFWIFARGAPTPWCGSRLAMRVLRRSRDSRRYFSPDPLLRGRPRFSPSFPVFAHPGAVERPSGYRAFSGEFPMFRVFLPHPLASPFNLRVLSPALPPQSTTILPDCRIKHVPQVFSLPALWRFFRYLFFPGLFPHYNLRFSHPPLSKPP